MECLSIMDEQNLLFKEISPTFINIKNAIYSTIFGKKQFKKPVDSLVFGFFLGYFSSKPEYGITETNIKTFMDIYLSITKETKELDKVFEKIAKEFSYNLIKESRENNSITQINQLKKSNNSNVVDINEPINLFYENVADNTQNQKVNQNMNQNQNINATECFNNYNIKNNNNHNENIIQEASHEWIKCKICLEEFDILDEVNYGINCGCIIHHKCFDTYIANQINEKKFPIKCPYCNAEDIQPTYIYDSLYSVNDRALIENFEKSTWNKYICSHVGQVNHCPTAGCDYVFYYENNDTQFICPLCNSQYCLKCKNDWHEGWSCQQFKNYRNENYLDNWFEGVTRAFHYKKCPNCGIWVEKIDGCNQVKCACEASFCFECGFNYFNCNNNKHYCRKLKSNISIQDTWKISRKARALLKKQNKMNKK